MLLSNNYISTLPLEIGTMNRLRYLDLEYNMYLNNLNK